MKKINVSDMWHKQLDTVELVDDFFGLDTTTWLTTTTDSGTVAEDADGINGIVTLTPSDGSVGDNDEAYLYTNEWAKFLADKPFSLMARLQYAEAATDDANILFGIGEGFGAANTLQDNGAGPPADYDGCCFFKVDGETRWRFESSLGTTQETTILNVTAGGAGFVCLGIDVVPLYGGAIKATPWIDSSGGLCMSQPQKYDASLAISARLPLVQHSFTFTTPGEMAL
jgi:hypothetical protein